MTRGSRRRFLGAVLGPWEESTFPFARGRRVSPLYDAEGNPTEAMVAVRTAYEKMNPDIGKFLDRVDACMGGVEGLGLNFNVGDYVELVIQEEEGLNDGAFFFALYHPEVSNLLSKKRSLAHCQGLSRTDASDVLWIFSTNALRLLAENTFSRVAIAEDDFQRAAYKVFRGVSGGLLDVFSAAEAEEFLSAIPGDKLASFRDILIGQAYEDFVSRAAEERRDLGASVFFRTVGSLLLMAPDSEEQMFFLRDFVDLADARRASSICLGSSTVSVWEGMIQEGRNAGLIGEAQESRYEPSVLTAEEKEQIAALRGDSGLLLGGWGLTDYSDLDLLGVGSFAGIPEYEAAKKHLSFRFGLMSDQSVYDVLAVLPFSPLLLRGEFRFLVWLLDFGRKWRLSDLYLEEFFTQHTGNSLTFNRNSQEHFAFGEYGVVAWAPGIKGLLRGDLRLGVPKMEDAPIETIFFDIDGSVRWQRSKVVGWELSGWLFREKRWPPFYSGLDSVIKNNREIGLRLAALYVDSPQWTKRYLDRDVVGEVAILLGMRPPEGSSDQKVFHWFESSDSLVEEETTRYESGIFLRRKAQGQLGRWAYRIMGMSGMGEGLLYTSRMTPIPNWAILTECYFVNPKETYLLMMDMALSGGAKARNQIETFLQESGRARRAVANNRVLSLENGPARIVEMPPGSEEDLKLAIKEGEEKERREIADALSFGLNQENVGRAVNAMNEGRILLPITNKVVQDLYVEWRKSEGDAAADTRPIDADYSPGCDCTWCSGFHEWVGKKLVAYGSILGGTLAP